MTKIFRNDKYIGSFKVGKRHFHGNQYRSKKPSLWEKIKRAFQVTVMYGALTLTVVLLIELGGIVNPIIKVEARDVLVDNLSTKIESLKREVVNKIKACESAGSTDGLITFDPHATNKSVEPPSIGLLQFKITTVQHYYQKLYQQKITRKEAILVALDDEKAKQLAYDIMWKSGSGLADWYTCGNKQEVKDLLKVIKQLTK